MRERENERNRERERGAQHRPVERQWESSGSSAAQSRRQASSAHICAREPRRAGESSANASASQRRRESDEHCETTRGDEHRAQAEREREHRAAAIGQRAGAGAGLRAMRRAARAMWRRDEARERERARREHTIDTVGLRREARRREAPRRGSRGAIVRACARAGADAESILHRSAPVLYSTNEYILTHRTHTTNMSM